MKLGIKGRFRTEIIEAGRQVWDSGEQDNLVLDGYLSLGRAMSENNVLCIGAGVATPPTVTDTELFNQVDYESINLGGYSASVEADGFILSRYGSTDFTGLDYDDLSELGLRDGVGGTLITRSLIKDGSGDPTTISVGPGQTLRITYTLYFYVPFVVSSGTVSTPHGDLDWAVGIPPSSRTQAAANGAANSLIYARYIGVKTNGYSNFSAQLFHTSGSVSTSNFSVSKDIANRKETASCTFPAQQSNITLGGSAPNEDIIVGLTYSFGNTNLYCPTGNTITIPANYDFSITYDVTWGRAS